MVSRRRNDEASALADKDIINNYNYQQKLASSLLRRPWHLHQSCADAACLQGYAVCTTKAMSLCNPDYSDVKMED